ncbi:lytic transglycosylase domain-containing protein [Oceanisphaera sp. IT1-181]|uniref:lytic transglycosylase domain-containing protein n=1 Tax=Oceanisphaera sp. IT1-181 TaxID=3081199 RepID=UPI0029CA2D40|nr:lytic transglycosylase domain-containing protein [Oceanisphaera sp. IT1-181]
MKAPTLIWLVLSLSTGVHADVYVMTASDGSITLTNIPAKGKRYTLLRREPKVVTPQGARIDHVLAPLPSLKGRPFAALITQVAQEQKLSENLLHGIISAESSYNPSALSPKGAIGLMQLMPDTAKELGVDDAWDPLSNIRGGARYVKRLMKMFDNDLSLVLAAYNAGPGAVRTRGDIIPPFPETQQYVAKVTEHYRQLQAMVH